MDLKEVLTGLELAKTEYDKLIKEAASPLRSGLVNFVRDAGIPGLIWEQYTPHFNDGDECIFGVHEIALILQNVDEVTNHYDEENCLIEISYQDWDTIMREDRPIWHEETAALIERVGLTREKFESVKAFCKQLMGMEDVLQSAFGDHVSVKVTATGLEVEKIDHD